VRKRFTAITVALATLPMAAVMSTNSAAIAAPGAHCGEYPPGLAYAMRISRTPGQPEVPPGTQISLYARLLRNGEVCSGRTVFFYAHGPREFSSTGRPLYHRSATAVTSGQGLAHAVVTARNDFRWFACYNCNPSAAGATSGPSGARTSGRDLVQTTG
jgi:hypothetical protein